MPLLKTSTPNLVLAAARRAQRSDIGSTAIWHYPAEQPKAKILMVHGFRGNHLGLSAQTGCLSDYQIAIPDLPGYGKSEEFAGLHHLDAYGTWLKDLVSKLGEDWVVLGHSFGSLVVANAASKGMRCKAILLQNPITTRASDQKSIANWVADSFYRVCSNLGQTGSALLRSAVVVRIMSIAMTTSRNLRLRSFIHDQHHRFFSNYRSDRVAYEGYQAASTSNVMDYVEYFNQPVLIMAGEKDSIAPLGNQVLAQQNIASAELVVIPKVGHLTHYETPVEIATAIDEFLDRL
jgi:pimeloyl-ACP methyl ester carboxylesterase